jgi:hypothetical protein
MTLPGTDNDPYPCVPGVFETASDAVLTPVGWSMLSVIGSGFVVAGFVMMDRIVGSEAK